MTQTRRTFLKTGAAVGAAAVLRFARGAASLTETATNAPAITAPLSQLSDMATWSCWKGRCGSSSMRIMHFCLRVGQKIRC